MPTARALRAPITARRQTEGAGFVVRRPFPSPALPAFDPLLMLDEMGPVDYPPGAAKGAPDHPHRGFETVSYILAGQVEHADSAGHAGTLGPGDVQWMTAGSGVVHREMPAVSVQEQGGRVHGFQLWVNLPRSHKRSPPRYQELPSAQIPEVQSEDGKAKVRVIAGEALGVTARARTHTPITYLHIVLAEGGALDLPVPADQNLGLYVFEGAFFVGEDRLEAGQFGPLTAGDHLPLRGAGSALLLGGQPLGEPIARYGPFVMNTREEIIEAMDDYAAGRMGRIPPEIVRA